MKIDLNRYGLFDFIFNMICFGIAFGISIGLLCFDFQAGICALIVTNICIWSHFFALNKRNISTIKEDMMEWLIENE